MNHLEEVLALAARGWPMFPLGEMSKFPKIPKSQGGRGYKDATTDPEQLAAWWRRWQRANLGLATGERAGLLVIDVDPRHGGDGALDELERQHGRLPRTLTVTTPTGGRHLYFARPKGVDITIGAAKLGTGLDHRADGGYVVAPPSRRPEGFYRWVDTEAPILPPPAWLVAKLRKRERVEAGAVITTANHTGDTVADEVLRRAVTEVASAPAHQGNGTLNGWAYSLGRYVGAELLDRKTVADALLAAAIRRGVETEHRAEVIIASGLDAGIANPRKVVRFEGVGG